MIICLHIQLINRPKKAFCNKFLIKIHFLKYFKILILLTTIQQKIVSVQDKLQKEIMQNNIPK